MTLTSFVISWVIVIGAICVCCCCLMIFQMCFYEWQYYNCNNICPCIKNNNDIENNQTDTF